LVAPDQEGRGIGSQLLEWAEWRDRDRGRDVHRQWVAAAIHAVDAASFAPAPDYTPESLQEFTTSS
jgi:GNAT superfamily N-acetyltransferase